MTIVSKTANENYRNNYERIFGIKCDGCKRTIPPGDAVFTDSGHPGERFGGCCFDTAVSKVESQR